MEELILSVKETDEDEVEVLVGFLLYQVVAKLSDSLAVLMVVYVLLENRQEDVEAVLLWWEFCPLDRVNLELLREEDLADEDLVEELDSHNLGGLLGKEEVQAPDEVNLLGLVCQEGLDSGSCC